MERMFEEEQGGYWAFPLANNEVAEKGKLACIDTANGGVIVKGKTVTGLISIGWFQESFTGDGTKKIQIKLHRELQASWWDNDDAPNALAAADRGALCYIKTDEQVSKLATGRSVAGMVLDVDAVQGVLVVFGLKTNS